MNYIKNVPQYGLSQEYAILQNEKYKPRIENKLKKKGEKENATN